MPVRDGQGCESRVSAAPHQLPSVCLPGGDLLTAHCQIDGVDLHAVSGRIWGLLLLQNTLVVIRVRRFVEPCGQTKVGQLQVTVLVDKHIVRFDVPN